MSVHGPVLHALAQHLGEGAVAADPDREGVWRSNCPRCVEADLAVTLIGEEVAVRCYGGCDEALVLAALGLHLPPRRIRPVATPLGERVRLIPASQVRPRKAGWLWRLRVPRRAPWLLAGEEGLGKSQLLVWATARVTRGELEGDLHGMPSSVVIASAEDAIEEVLQPRLMAAGADLDRVFFVAVDEDGLRLPDDVEALGRRVEEVGAALAWADPLVAFIPSEHSTHRDQHVRRVMAPLARLAADRGVSIGGVVHLNKSEAEKALKRVGGSVAFTAAARSVLILGSDPTDPDGDRGSRRILAHAKSNYGPRQPSLDVRVEAARVESEDGRIETSRCDVLGESSVEADDLVRIETTDERTARDDAEEFLADHLAVGPRPKSEVQKAADLAGIKPRTLRRAKERMNVESIRPGGQGPWLWELPAELGGHLPVSPERWPSRPSSPSAGHLAPELGGQPELDDHASPTPGHLASDSLSERDGEEEGELGGQPGQDTCARTHALARAKANGHLPDRGWSSADASAFIERAKAAFAGAVEVGPDFDGGDVIEMGGR